jgi:hypothetical protein
MHLRIRVGAAITDDDQAIIQVAGVANGRQPTPLVWTPATTSVSMPLARSSISRSAPPNGLMRCLTTIGSASRGAAAGWIAAPSLPATIIPFAFRALCVAGADLGMAGPECDNDMDHHHARAPRDGDQVRHARDRIGGLRRRHEPGEGIDLIVHHQQRGAPRIDGRKLRHGSLLAGDVVMGGRSVRAWRSSTLNATASNRPRRSPHAAWRGATGQRIAEALQTGWRARGDQCGLMASCRCACRSTGPRRSAPWNGSAHPGYSGGRALTSFNCLSSSGVSVSSTAARLS